MSDTPPVAAPAPIQVSPNSVVTNPAWAATAVVLGFLGGYLVKAGLISDVQLSALIPAVMTLAVVIWRAWVAHTRAKQAIVMANAAPDAVAVVKPK